MKATFTYDRGAERGAVRLSWTLVIAALLVVAALSAAALFGWLSPARERIVAVLQSPDASWLNAATIGTAAAVAGVLAPFLIRWLDRRHPLAPDEPAGHGQQRAVMLRRVRYKWTTGVLQPSLTGAAHLVLGWERRRDLLDLGVRVVGHPGWPPAPLRQGASISDLLDKVGGGLLIVGAPGAGKTTMLLQLCDELLDRATTDPHQPIPVVLNLSSWARQRPPFQVWLVDELARGYYVPRRLATAWVAQDALALLLDGLDEVASPHRAACAEAINTWREEHGLVPVVICSRTDELQTLGPRLRLEEAVELQPPSDAQVDRYLRLLEATGTPVNALRDALATDQDLRQLLQSPLTLHVVALAYQGRPASALQVTGTFGQRHSWLWQAYVARMFEQRPPASDSGYSQEEALRWLAWLAGALQVRGQTEFYLDRLAPEWLPTDAQRRRAQLTIAVASGLVGGLAFGLTFALVANGLGLTFGLVRALAVGVGCGLAFGVVAGLVFGLAGALALGIESTEGLRLPSSGLRAELARGLRLRMGGEQTRATERDRPVARNAPFAAAFGLAGGLVAAVVGGLIGGPPYAVAAGLGGALTIGLASGLVSALAGGLITAVEATERVHWSWSKLRAGLARGLAGGLIGGIGAGLAAGLAGGLSIGLRFGVIFGLALTLVGTLANGLSSELRDEHTVPNEGIRRSATNSLGLGLALGTVGGMTVAIGSWLILGPAIALAAGLGLGLGFGTMVWLLFGGAACLQHYVVRASLVRAGIAPWQYGSFLEAMAQRLLLRRSGGAYLFMHRLLGDYLAAPRPDQGQR